MKRLFCLQAKKTASLLYTRTRYQVNNIDVVVSLWIFPTMPFQYVSSPRGHAAATRPPHTEAQGVVGERTGPSRITGTTRGPRHPAVFRVLNTCAVPGILFYLPRVGDSCAILIFQFRATSYCCCCCCCCSPRRPWGASSTVRVIFSTATTLALMIPPCTLLL